MFSTGKARRRVTLISPTEDRDATYGQITYGWTNIATVWADYQSGGKNLNSENVEGNKIVQARRTRFFIRYSSTVSAINEKWAVAMGGLVYAISDLFINKEDGFIRIDAEHKGESVTT